MTKNQIVKNCLLANMLIIMTVTLLFITTSKAYASEIVASGTMDYGAVTWTLDDEGTFTVSGEGAMSDFSKYAYRPWNNYCSQITSVVIEDGITHIGRCAFAETRIETIDIPSSVTSIGDSAFAYTRISHFVIKKDVEYGQLLFFNSSLETVDIEEGVTDITGLFQSAHQLQSVSLPSSINEIGESTFWHCDSLYSINLENVESIGSNAFYACGSLSNLSFSDKLKTIGDAAFVDCMGLSSVELPTSLMHIGNSAFSGCRSLTQIVIPDSVEELGNSAFSGCSDLVSASISQKITAIPQNLFNGCTVLTHVQMSENVKSIGEAAFAYCGFTEFTIGEKVTTIGTSAFSGCKIRCFSIPKNVVRIGEAALGSSLLEEINVDAENDNYCSVDGVLFSKDMKTLIAYPKKRVAENNNYSIPNGVESFKDDFSFYYISNSFDSLTLPSSIKSFKIQGCTITNLFLPSSTSQLSSNSLTGTISNIYLPRGKAPNASASAISTQGNTVIHVPEGASGYDVNPWKKYTIEYDLDPVALNGIALSKTELNFDNTLQETLHVIPDPSDVTVTYDLRWVSDNEQVATVDNEGKVTAEDIGHATITVYAGEFSATCAVTVNRANPKVDVPTNIEASCNITLAEVDLPEGFAWKDPSQSVGTAGEKSFDAVYTPSDTEHYNTLENIEIAVSVNHAFGEEFTSDGSSHWNECACGEKTDITEHAYDDWTKITAPTCTEKGENERTCSICGYKDKAEVAAVGHDWFSDYTVDTAPTCVEPGSKSIHCKNCTEKKQVTDVAALGHAYGETVIASTCSQKGYTIHVCGRCGDSYTDNETAALSHEFSDWIIDTDSTCTAEGSQHRTCDKCGYTETKGVNKKEHSFAIEYTIDKAATCTTDGSKSYHCTVDGCTATTGSEVISAVGHQYSEWTVKKAATCEEAGISEHECSICHAKETLTLPATDHEWMTKATVDIEPTCTDVGSKSIHCKACDAVKDVTVEAIPAIGHSYESWETTKDPTCTETGKETRTCSSCGNEEVEAIPASGHAWLNKYTVDKEATCTESGEKSIHCKVCDAIKEDSKVTIEPLGHEYTEAVVEPTCSQKGYTLYVCGRCGDNYTDNEIDAVGHKFGDWISDTDSTCTVEGIQHRECTECRYIETKGINKKEHSFSTEYTIDKDATCTTDGSKSYHCTVDGCTATTGSEVIPAVGHQYTEWKETKEPTCEGSGDAERSCTVCGVKETIHFEARGHVWMGNLTVDKYPTCNEEGSESIHCLICDVIKENSQKVIPKTSHKFGAWKTTKEATESAAGQKTRTCSLCGETETEAIPRLDPTPTSEPGTDPNQKGSDGTAVGPGASVAAAEKAIMNAASDEGPAGTKFAQLKLKSTKQTKTSVKLTWTKVAGATKYVIYGNQCGKSNKMKKLGTATGSSKTFKKIAGKNLGKGKYYKFIVVALDKNNSVVSSSKVIHVATKGGKVGNHKSVTVTKEVISKAKKLKKGKSLKLKAKAVKASKLAVKQHRAISYESSNPKVATVSKKGVVKGKKKGTCYVYAYAQNGVFKKIKVVIK